VSTLCNNDQRNDFENVKRVVANIDINLGVNYEDHTPLDWAIVNKNREMAKFLLSKGAPVHLKTKDIFYLQVKEQFIKHNESGKIYAKNITYIEGKEHDREVKQLKTEVKDLQTQFQALQGMVAGLFLKIEKLETEKEGWLVQLQQQTEKIEKLKKLEEKVEKLEEDEIKIRIAVRSASLRKGDGTSRGNMAEMTHVEGEPTKSKKETTDTGQKIKTGNFHNNGRIIHRWDTCKRNPKNPAFYGRKKKHRVLRKEK